jgi:hypothetical protein
MENLNLCLVSVLIASAFLLLTPRVASNCGKSAWRQPRNSFEVGYDIRPAPLDGEPIDH